MYNFKKIDLLFALIIGELCAWIMVFLGRNLVVENPALAVTLSYLVYLPIVFPLLCAAGLLVAYILSKIVPVFYQIAKFVLVGGLNFLLDLGVLSFLIFYTGITVGFVESGFKGVSFVVAVTSSYLWNKFWTFKREQADEKASKEFLQFIAVSVAGLVINMSVNYIFVNMVSPFGAMPLTTWAQLSAVMAAAVGMFWNFLGFKFIVFDVKKTVLSQTNEQSRPISQIPPR